MAALGNALEIVVPSWQDEGWSGEGTRVQMKEPVGK